MQQSEVEERVSAFKRFNLEVSKVMPDVVLATINILFAQYQKIKSNEYIPSKYQDASQDKVYLYTLFNYQFLICIFICLSNWPI